MSDLAEQLAAVGFTEYEARVYIALLRSSPATGYQIAKDSGVPRSMIYEVLDRLTARGAAVTQSFGDVVRYAPVPPDLLLDRMRHEFEDTLDRLTEGFKQIAGAPAVPGHAWSIEGRDNILARAREMIEQAVHEVVVAVSDDDELDAVVMWLQRARARQVALTVISPVPYDAGGVPLLVHPEGQRLRHVLGHGLTLAVDGREALLGETDRSQGAIWTTNPYAVAWVVWCLKEMAGRPARKTGARRRKA